MKLHSMFKKWWMLLLVPVLMQGVCNKDNDDVETPNADQYVTWKITGANGSLKVPSDSLDFVRSGTFTAIYGMTKPTAATSFSVSFDGPQQAGTYPASYFSIYTNGKYFVPTSTPLQINVTTYGSAGQYVIGTYSGNVKDSTTSAVVPVSGEFRVKYR